MVVRNVVYRLYESRLRRQLTSGPKPRHVALVMDGNRRWARQMGMENPSLGHQYGAEHAEEVLRWCAEAGIRHVTIFMASVDNVAKRPPAEVDFLMQVIERFATQSLEQPAGRWRVLPAGRLDVLPDSTAHALKRAQDATRDRDADGDLTIAVGYDGREEIADALRSLLDQHAQAGATLAELAQTLTADDIAAHLYTAGQPDPDLIIRTSGEHRLSGFLIWQATHSQLHFCDVYWPGFRRIDFLRALRSFADSRRPKP